MADVDIIGTIAYFVCLVAAAAAGIFVVLCALSII